MPDGFTFCCWKALEEAAGALSMFSFSTEPMAVLVKRILTRSLPVSRTKVSSLMATHAADDAADGGHLIPDLQAVAHCCVLFSPAFSGDGRS